MSDVFVSFKLLSGVVRAIISPERNKNVNQRVDCMKTPTPNRFCTVEFVKALQCSFLRWPRGRYGSNSNVVASGNDECFGVLSGQRAYKEPYHIQ